MFDSCTEINIYMFSVGPVLCRARLAGSNRGKGEVAELSQRSWSCSREGNEPGFWMGPLYLQLPGLGLRAEVTFPDTRGKGVGFGGSLL